MTAKEVSPVAFVGNLKRAVECLKAGLFSQAWNETVDAIKLRPCHPEAYGLFEEIEKQAGFAATKVFRRPNRPAEPTLTVCMIVKNEAEFLANALASVKPIASQIVVVDTGSTDATIDIAKRYGAEVYSFAWINDFAAARNFGLERARGDWVLVLDADEEIPQSSYPALRHDMRPSRILGYRIPIKNVGSATAVDAYVPRLFRNAPGLFFVGSIHEQIHASVLWRCQQWGMEATLGTATIVHHGYQEHIVRQRGKIKRNLAMMEAVINDHPNEPALLMNYGLDLVNDGQLQLGLEKYRQAMRAMEAQPLGQVAPEVRERLLTLFGCHLSFDRRYEELAAVMTSRLATESGPTPSIAFMAGIALMRLGKFSDAAKQFRICIERAGVPLMTAPNPHAYGPGPHHLLGECLFDAHRFDEALPHYKRAAAMGVRQAFFDYARCEQFGQFYRTHGNRIC